MVQPPRPIRGDNSFDFPADLRQDLDAAILKRNLQLLRNATANEHVDTHFAKAADDSFALLLKQYNLSALQFGLAFEPNHKQARRHIEHGRHTALAIGNRNQHDCRERDFHAIPNQVGKQQNPLKMKLIRLCSERQGSG